MFDDNFISEYKSIKAPDELYQRILREEKKENTASRVVVFRRVAAMAAAIAVMIGVGFMLRSEGTRPSVYVNGSELTETVTFAGAQQNGIMLARNLNELACEVDIEFSVPTEITADGGILTAEDGTVILASGSAVTREGAFKAVWTIPGADNELVYSLSFEDKDGSYRIKLYFDGEADCWTAELTK